MIIGGRSSVAPMLQCVMVYSIISAFSVSHTESAIPQEDKVSDTKEDNSSTENTPEEPAQPQKVNCTLRSNLNNSIEADINSVIMGRYIPASLCLLLYESYEIDSWLIHKICLVLKS